MSDHNDSSSDDEDYVPNAAEASESESDDEDSLSEEHQKDRSKPSRGKKRKGKEKFSSRKRKGGIKLDEEQREGSEVSEEEGTFEDNEGKSSSELVLEELSEELKKKKADDLWSSFLKDVNVPSKPKPSVLASTPVQKLSSNSSEKVTVTKIYNFAGEEVKITEELKSPFRKTENKPLDISKELNNSASLLSSPEGTNVVSSSSAKLNTSSPGLIRPAKGLSSVLNKINKKNNINTLMKSKLDWESFKADEGIQDELQIHNKGKDGFLEKMAFLERSDLRQFEIEKNLRATSRSKK